MRYRQADMQQHSWALRELAPRNTLSRVVCEEERWRGGERAAKTDAARSTVSGAKALNSLAGDCGSKYPSMELRVKKRKEKKYIWVSINHLYLKISTLYKFNELHTSWNYSLFLDLAILPITSSSFYLCFPCSTNVIPYLKRISSYQLFALKMKCVNIQIISTVTRDLPNNLQSTLQFLPCRT